MSYDQFVKELAEWVDHYGGPYNISSSSMPSELDMRDYFEDGTSVQDCAVDWVDTLREIRRPGYRD